MVFLQFLLVGFPHPCSSIGYIVVIPPKTIISSTKYWTFIDTFRPVSNEIHKFSLNERNIPQLMICFDT